MNYTKKQLLEAVFVFSPQYKRDHEDGFTFDLIQSVRDATLEWILSEYTESGVLRGENNLSGEILLAALNDMKYIGHIVCRME